MIRISRRIALDESELVFDFVRSSGPGGQNVNKVATAVRLRFDVPGSRSLPADVRLRLVGIAGRRIAKDGTLSIFARRYRTQDSNRRDAVARLVRLIERAAVRPKPRRKTLPTRAARERRLEEKRIRGGTKAGRKAVRPEAD
jgi:ribosome-associated protein